LIAGDMNATIQNADRLSGVCYTADSTHRSFLIDSNLAPLDPPTPGVSRACTYRKHKSETCWSRIDDILSPKLLPNVETKTKDMTGTNLDHNMLVATVPYTSISATPPLSPPIATAQKTKLKTPMTLKDSRALRQRLAQTQSQAWDRMANRVASLVNTYVIPHWTKLDDLEATTIQTIDTLEGKPAQEVVNALGTQITELLVAAHNTALTTCATITTQPHGLRGRKCPRSIARHRNKIVEAKKAASIYIRGLKGTKHTQHPPETADQHCTDSAQPSKAQASPLTPPHNSKPSWNSEPSRTQTKPL